MIDIDLDNETGIFLTKLANAITAVIKIGHGSVEVIIKDGKVMDIVKKERERIN
jgi:hypothetical protein